LRASAFRWINVANPWFHASFEFGDYAIREFLNGVAVLGDLPAVRFEWHRADDRRIAGGCKGETLNEPNSRILDLMAKKSRRIEFGNMWAEGETPESNHERWGNHWMAWMYWIFVLERSARMIGEQVSHEEDKDGEVVMPAVLAVRAMLTGYAIECSLKCLWVKTGHRIVEKGKFIGVRGAGSDHNLIQLASAVGFAPNTRERDVLARLSKFIRFAGRYPIAKGPTEMSPMEVDGLGKLDVGYFSKADFRTCLSILNKIMTMISGKKRRTFQPIGTLDYLVRADRAALRRKLRGGE
jgi:hypothetical protein